jgi:hypothetical protein
MEIVKINETKTEKVVGEDCPKCGFYVCKCDEIESFKNSLKKEEPVKKETESIIKAEVKPVEEKPKPSDPVSIAKSKKVKRWLWLKIPVLLYLLASTYYVWMTGNVIFFKDQPVTLALMILHFIFVAVYITLFIKAKRIEE